MKPKRVSWGNLDYRATTTGAASRVGERGGRVCGALAEIQSKAGALSDSACALLASMPARADVLSATLVDAYADQLNEIEHLRARPANWSTAPVAAPDTARTNAAQRGLIMLLLAGIPAPTLMLLNDGTVAAFWRHADAYASMDFDADGEFAWSAANAGKVTSGTWTGGVLPAPLHEIIAA
ncbi:hypothetical protein IV454_07485 [Massilia antarctica]|uniref:DUF551 domain-containing protein n=1 Tax=Massilia antarctica TaxID=2765360 RepID=A0AA48WFI8_9BURK|nr:hypothetical protein [Massilia antarctica]QPI51353.1 hypothetical protein IV454_07485 [Massilia antarctica]